MIARFLALMVIFGLGVLARRLYRLDPTPLSHATMDFFMPAFVFLSILETPLDWGSIGHPAAACAWVILGAMALVGLAQKISGQPIMKYVLPIAFMNSGFFGIPIAETMGGAAWVAPVIIFDQAMNLVLFTAGISVLGAHTSLSQGIRNFALNPNLVAIAIAFSWKATGRSFPEEIRTLLALPAQATIPVALFCMGAALPRLGAHTAWRPLIGAVAARFGLGILLSSAYVLIFRPDPLTARVIILVSTMPSAVFSYLLNVRYKGEAQHAAETIFVSTLSFPLVFPLVNGVLVPLLVR